MPNPLVLIGIAVALVLALIAYVATVAGGRADEDYEELKERE